MTARPTVTSFAVALLGAAMLAVSAAPARASATQGAGGGKIKVASGLAGSVSDEGPEELIVLTRYQPALTIPRP